MIFAAKTMTSRVNNRQGGGPSLSIRSGPLALCSGGTFLLVVGTALMLPGRDIQSWPMQGHVQGHAPQGHSQWEEQSQADEESLFYSRLRQTPPALAPNTLVSAFQGTRRRSFHWRAACPVLANPPARGWHKPLLTMPYTEAQSRHLYPCFYCQDMEKGINSVSLTRWP